MSQSSPSSKQVDAAGKRVSKHAEASGDRELIRRFRDSRAGNLIAAFEIVESCLPGEVEVVSARVKRVISIVRKCLKLDIQISRMDDLIGIRVVVPSMNDQASLCERLRAQSGYQRSKDYVGVHRPDGYWSCHELFRIDGQGEAAGGSVRFEVQVRTLAQHLWASTSEALGLQVKDGGGPPEIRESLSSLAASLRDWEKSDVGEAAQLLDRSQSGDPSYSVLLANSDILTHELIRVDDLGEAMDRVAFYEGQEATGRNRDAVLLYSNLDRPDRLTHMSYDPPRLIKMLEAIKSVQVPGVLTQAMLR